MYNSIILASCVFGSVYLCCKSLVLINNAEIENKKIQNKLIMINGLTFVMSCSMFAYMSINCL